MKSLNRKNMMTVYCMIPMIRLHKKESDVC
jgi:hypothetical protein